MRLLVKILSLLVFIILPSCTSCDDDEDGDDYLTDTISVEPGNPEDAIVHIQTEEERIDSILRVNVPHDTASMYELPNGRDDLPQDIRYRFSYSVSYNPQTRIANWVAWHLSRSHTDGQYSRSKLNPPYYEDNDDLRNMQYLKDWHNAFPYEHGHLCPAADNKWDEAAMRQSFFLSNIAPQHRDFNGSDWLTLENTCRSWAKSFGEIYIVTGPIFDKSVPDTLTESSIAIPDRYFKAILCLNPKPMAIGFIFKNDGAPQSLNEVAVSVDKIERITGYDFFHLIDDETENRIESTYNLSDWNL